MAEDFMCDFDVETAEGIVFYEIEAKLMEQGRSFRDFAIPRPSVAYRLASENSNQEEELRIGKELYQTLNEDQRLAANEILTAYHQRKSPATTSCFFIDGSGGTGKTHLYNTCIDRNSR